MEDAEAGAPAGEEPGYPSVLAAAAAADWSALEARLAKHPEEARLKSYHRPLHVAVEKGAPLQTVEALLEAAGDTRLLAASARDDVLRLPLHNLNSKTPLEVVEALIAANPSAVTAADSQGRLPIHRALAEGASAAVVSKLLGVTAESALAQMKPDSTADRSFPLHKVSSKTSAAAVAAILKAVPAAAEAKDAKSRLPLHLALDSFCNAEVVETLIRAHLPAVVHKDSNSMLPLHLAIGTHGDIRGSVGEAVLRLVLDANRSACAEAVPSSGSLPLHLAVAGGFRPAIVQAILDVYPAAASVVDKSGRTALHLLSPVDKADEASAAAGVARLLLLANPSAATTEDHTDGKDLPLHAFLKTANATGCAPNQAAVRALLEAHPAAASHPDGTGGLPLHYLPEHASAGVVAALLAAHPAAAFARNADGQMPLHRAVVAGLGAAAVEVLLDAYPAAIATDDSAGLRPLHCMRGSTPVEILSAICRREPTAAAAVSSVHSGRFPLHFGAANGLSAELLVALIELCPQAAAEADAAGAYPLHLAVAGDAEPAAITALLAAFPEAAQLPDSEGRLPLHLVGGEHFLEAAQVLLAAHPGAAAERDCSGDLPLHAVLRGNNYPERQLVKLLLETYPQSVALESGGDGALPLMLLLESAYFGEWEEAYLIFVDLLASLIAADPSAAARSGWLDDEGIPSTLLAISIGMQAPFALILQVLRAHPATAAEKQHSTTGSAPAYPLVELCRFARHILPDELDEEAVSADGSLADLVRALAEAHPPAVVASCVTTQQDDEDSEDDLGCTPLELLRREVCFCGGPRCPAGSVSRQALAGAAEAEAALALAEMEYRTALRVSRVLSVLPLAALSSKTAAPAAAAAPPAAGTAAAAAALPVPSEIAPGSGRLQLRLLLPLADTLSAEAADLMRDAAGWLYGIVEAEASVGRTTPQPAARRAKPPLSAAAVRKAEAVAAARTAPQPRIEVSATGHHSKGCPLGFVSQADQWPEMDIGTESMAAFSEAFQQAAADAAAAGGGARPRPPPRALFTSHTESRCDVCGVHGSDTAGLFSSGWLRCTKGCDFDMCGSCSATFLGVADPVLPPADDCCSDDEGEGMVMSEEEKAAKEVVKQEEKDAAKAAETVALARLAAEKAKGRYALLLSAAGASLADVSARALELTASLRSLEEARLAVATEAAKGKASAAVVAEELAAAAARDAAKEAAADGIAADAAGATPQKQHQPGGVENQKRRRDDGDAHEISQQGPQAAAAESEQQMPAAVAAAATTAPSSAKKSRREIDASAAAVAAASSGGVEACVSGEAISASLTATQSSATTTEEAVGPIPCLGGGGSSSSKAAVTTVQAAAAKAAAARAASDEAAAAAVAAAAAAAEALAAPARLEETVGRAAGLLAAALSAAAPAIDACLPPPLKAIMKAPPPAAAAAAVEAQKVPLPELAKCCQSLIETLVVIACSSEECERAIALALAAPRPGAAGAATAAPALPSSSSGIAAGNTGSGLRSAAPMDVDSPPATALPLAAPNIGPPSSSPPPSPGGVPMAVCDTAGKGDSTTTSGGAVARLAERHRALLNAAVQASPALLDSRTFNLVLQLAPKVLSFTTRAAHFRAKVAEAVAGSGSSAAEAQRRTRLAAAELEFEIDAIGTYGRSSAYASTRAAHVQALREDWEQQHPVVAAAPLKISVSRARVLEDTFEAFTRVTTADLKVKRTAITFKGEVGLDEGGLTREWFSLLSRAVFDPQAALFVPCARAGVAFQPSKDSSVNDAHLEYFKFVGRVVGKALLDGHALDVYFTRAFYKQILGQAVTYEDIEEVDPQYFRTLKWMLENPIDGVLDDLTFSEEEEFFGTRKVVELKARCAAITAAREAPPGGAAIAVTDANKREYVALIAEHRTSGAIKEQTKAFCAARPSRSAGGRPQRCGFHDLVPRSLLSHFDAGELELLISGLPTLDVADLQANTEYEGYTAESTAVVWFWEVVRALPAEDVARLVMFATGSAKVPLEGFRALQGSGGARQKFQIHRCSGGDEGRLCSAHTCINQLDLPDYPTKEILAERLKMAIQEGAGSFGFV